MSEARNLKAGLVSLGCSKNQVDSEVMLGQLARQGFEITQDLAEAEVVVINTCGFIDAAKQESINTIIEYGKLKKEGRCRVLIATGCLTQRYPDELLKSLPELDAVVGTGDFPKIAEICSGLIEKKSPARKRIRQRFVEAPPYLYDAHIPRIRTGPAHWAYVKISEGCNYRCSFCAIPHFRGDLASRPEEDILLEVRRLASQGVKEVGLIAQSLTSYGWDRRGALEGTARPDRGALVGLLEKMARVDGIEWIRLFYMYPTDVTDELLDLISHERKICRYVDMPLQHINDRILRGMNRKGDGRLIRKLLLRIRERIPEVTIRSTFIVGFPGETVREFEELCGFVEETRFDRIGVFTYSHEDGTSAFSMEDSIPDSVKTERQTRLLNLQSEISLSLNRARLGTIQTVLVEGISSQTGQLEGRMEGQAPEIDGVVVLEGVADAGEFRKVEILDATESDLVGKLL
jgi:ribosomal protein S12 methylthiotransferase